jgi:hypothetical protein
MLTLPSYTSSLRTRPWRLRGGFGELLRRVFALILAGTVLTATLAAGHDYLWCSMMQQRVETCCCDPAPTAEEGRGDTQQQELRSGCCESKHAAVLGTGITTTRAVEVPAALPATCAPRTEPVSAVPKGSALPALKADVGRRERPIRAGPSSAAEACVTLQVFRC